MKLKTLEGWLWYADASKYKEHILPLVFLKRTGDVFEDEIKQLEDKYGSKELAETLAEGDRKLVRFFKPPEATWAFVRSQGARLGIAVPFTSKGGLHKAVRLFPELTAMLDELNKELAA